MSANMGVTLGKVPGNNKARRMCFLQDLDLPALLILGVRQWQAPHPQPLQPLQPQTVGHLGQAVVCLLVAALGAEMP